MEDDPQARKKNEKITEINRSYIKEIENFEKSKKEDEKLISSVYYLLAQPEAQRFRKEI